MLISCLIDIPRIKLAKMKMININYFDFFFVSRGEAIHSSMYKNLKTNLPKEINHSCMH